MAVLPWATDNWFMLLQSVGIVASLIYTAAGFRLDARTKRIENLLSITHSHREIWSRLFTWPELYRIFDADPDLIRNPITRDEAWFIRFLILHLNSAFYAVQEGVVFSLEQLRKDIRSFFTLPIPNAVWTKVRPFQDPQFVVFLEESLHEPVEDK